MYINIYVSNFGGGREGEGSWKRRSGKGLQFTVWTREVIAAMSESKCVLSTARAFGSSDRPPPVVEDDEPLPPPTECTGEMPSEC